MPTHASPTPDKAPFAPTEAAAASLPAGATAEEIASLAHRGLYDPAAEHDACGVGFVAHIKGEKTHAIVEQGLKILENLDHRGAVGADKLMGDGAGILIQIPDELLPRRDGRAGRRAAAARRIRRGHDLPAQGACLAPGLRAGTGARHQGRRPGAARLARRAGGPRRCRCRPAVRAKEPVIRQIFIGRGPDVIVPDALERKLYVIRKTASAAIQALQAHAQPRVLRAQHELPHGHLQGPAAGRPGGPVLPGPAGPARASRRWPWCTSASRPTPSPSGRWRTRTAWSRTTARSTPSRATSTGCGRAKA